MRRKNGGEREEVVKTVMEGHFAENSPTDMILRLRGSLSGHDDQTVRFLKCDPSEPVLTRFLGDVLPQSTRTHQEGGRCRSRTGALSTEKNRANSQDGNLRNRLGQLWEKRTRMVLYVGVEAAEELGR